VRTPAESRPSAAACANSSPWRRRGSGAPGSWHEHHADQLPIRSPDRVGQQEAARPAGRRWRHLPGRSRRGREPWMPAGSGTRRWRASPRRCRGTGARGEQLADVAADRVGRHRRAHAGVGEQQIPLGIEQATASSRYSTTDSSFARSPARSVRSARAERSGCRERAQLAELVGSRRSRFHAEFPASQAAEPAPDDVVGRSRSCANRLATRAATSQREHCRVDGRSSAWSTAVLTSTVERPIRIEPISASPWSRRRLISRVATARGPVGIQIDELVEGLNPVSVSKSPAAAAPRPARSGCCRRRTAVVSTIAA